MLKKDLQRHYENVQKAYGNHKKNATVIVKQLESRIAKLEAENASLRDRWDALINSDTAGEKVLEYALIDSDLRAGVNWQAVREAKGL